MIPEFTGTPGVLAIPAVGDAFIGPNRMKTGPAGRLKVIV